MTPPGGVEGGLGLGLAVEGIPLCRAGQRDLKPSAGFTLPVTDVVTMLREVLALQASQSIGRDRTQNLCSSCPRFQESPRAQGNAWGGRCSACRFLCSSELEVAGQVCDMMSLGKKSAH